MYLFHLVLSTTLLTGSAVSAIMPSSLIATSNPTPNNHAKPAPTFHPGFTLPPLGTPCNRTCSCTEGPQPKSGRAYCGFCWGIDQEGPGILWGTDVVRCGPNTASDCCNYGYLDGRCDVKDGSNPDMVRRFYCPDGMKKRDEGYDTIGSSSSTIEETSASTSRSSIPTLILLNPPPPADVECDPSCRCSTANKPVPKDPHYICGWCGPVYATSEDSYVDPFDLVMCKEGGCCNYGLYDERCNKTLDGSVPDWKLWCDWPVLELDNGAFSTASEVLGSTTRTVVITVPLKTSSTGEAKTMTMMESDSWVLPAATLAPA